MGGVAGSIGVKQDILLKQGATFVHLRISLRNPDKSLINIAAGQLFAVIKRSAGDTTAIATFTFIRESDTSYLVTLPASATAQIPCGETVKDALSKYFWDCKFTDPVGKVWPVAYGEVLVYRKLWP